MICYISTSFKSPPEFILIVSQEKSRNRVENDQEEKSENSQPVNSFLSGTQTIFAKWINIV